MPTEVRLPPLPAHIVIPNTVEELRESWGDGELWLALLFSAKQRWRGTIRDVLAKTVIEGLRIPQVGGRSFGTATFYGPLPRYNAAEIQWRNGELLAPVDRPPLDPVQLGPRDTLIANITLIN